MRGFAGGVHAGIGMRLDSLYFGVEGDYTLTGISKEDDVGIISTSVGATWLASVRGRVGIVEGDWLLYGTGGFAFGGMEASASVLCLTSKIEGDLRGYVVGGGIENRLAPGVTGRIEVLHYGFKNQSYDIGNFAVKYDANVNVVRAGVTVTSN